MASDLARLIERLGGIAPSRVRLIPRPGTATEADLIRDEASRDGPICELVEGTLVEKAMHMCKAVVHGQLMFALWRFVKPQRLGVALCGRAMYRLAPGTVRLPGGSFIRPVKYRAWAATKPDIADFAPDVAIEAVGEGDHPTRRRAKPASISPLTRRCSGRSTRGDGQLSFMPGQWPRPV